MPVCLLTGAQKAVMHRSPVEHYVDTNAETLSAYACSGWQRQRLIQGMLLQQM